MSYEKLFSGYQGQPYGKLLERVYGKEKVTPVEEAPIIAAPAPVPAAHTGREVSSILGSDPFGNDIILNKRQMERLLYLLGVSGAGKSTMLLNLILQNIEQGYGVCVLDPHGSLVEDVIVSIPEPRRKDVILLDLTNTKEYVFGLNLYQCDDVNDLDKVQRTMERIMHVWERLFRVSRDTPQIVQYMRKCAQTIIPNPGYTMAEIPLLFNNIPFRNKLLLNVADREVHDFWEDFDGDTKTDKMHNKGSILRKLDEFLVPIVKGIIGQSTSTINMWDIINASPAKILLVRLDNDMKGITSLIGSVVVAMIRSAAFFRQFMPEKDRKHFYLYADEFANFATEDFQDIIEQARKYFVFPVCAHQTRGVLHREVPALVEGTLQGNLVVFPGINDVDAREMAGNYNFTPEPEEIGRRKKQTHVTDVISTLLSKGSHANPVVNQFVHGTLKKIQICVDDRILADFNDLLYEGMTGVSRTRFLPDFCFTDISDYFNTRQIIKSIMPYPEFPCPYYVGVLDKCKDLLGSLKVKHDDKKAIDAIHQIWRETEGSLLYEQAMQALDIEVKNSIRNVRIIELQRDLNLIEKLRNGKADKETWHAEYNRFAFHQSVLPDKYTVSAYSDEWKDLLRQRIKIMDIATLVQIPRENWYPLDIIDTLVWTKDTTGMDGQWDLIQDSNGHLIQTPRFQWKLVPGQEFAIVNQYHVQLEQRIEEIFQPEKKVFFDFFRELKAVCQALYDDPPLGDSGQEEITYKKGSHDDKKAEIANKLSDDPDYTAYVRVGGAIQYCWHCGKKPAPSDKECQGCQKVLKHEYRVSATPVQKDASISVDAIIVEIVKQNVEKGYLRLRSEVEREILERQQSPEKQEAGIPDKVRIENKPAAVVARAAVPPTPRTKKK